MLPTLQLRVSTRFIQASCLRIAEIDHKTLSFIMHASTIAYGSSSWLLYIAACMLPLIGRALDELGQFPAMSPMLLGILGCGCSELNHTFMEYALSFFLTLVLTYTSQVVPLKSLPSGHPIFPSIHNYSS